MTITREQYRRLLDFALGSHVQTAAQYVPDDPRLLVPCVFCGRPTYRHADDCSQKPRLTYLRPERKMSLYEAIAEGKLRGWDLP